MITLAFIGFYQIILLASVVVIPAIVGVTILRSKDKKAV